MCDRYEMIRALDDVVTHIGPGSRVGADRLSDVEHGLVFGDPGAAAVVVIGLPGDLRDYLAAGLVALGDTPTPLYDDEGSSHEG